MKKLWMVVGLVAVVAVLGVMFAGAVALAQEPKDGADQPFNWRERLHEAIAGALGIGIDEYDAAVDTAQQQVLDEAVTEGWLTEEQAARMSEHMGQGFAGSGMWGQRGAMMGRGARWGQRGGMMGGGAMMAGSQSLLAVAAEELDMSSEELVAALQDGQTIADLATARGVELQAIADAFIATRAEWLAQAVADGRMTQAQADAMLAHMETQVLEHLNGELPFGGMGPGGCGVGGRGQRMGGGRFQGLPGTSDS